MLRTLMTRVYTCSCRHPQTVLGVSRIPSAAGTSWFKEDKQISKRYFHTANKLEFLERDVKHKKKLYDRATESKFEDSSEVADDEMHGLQEAGLLTPTLETHSMLIGGIKFSELPVVHVKSTLNNTITTLIDHKGNVLIHTSCGIEGFKNVKKSTNVAAQATGLSLGKKAVKMGVDTVKVMIQGLGAGRLASLKGMEMAGMTIVSISDQTILKHNMRHKPRKQKKR